MPDIRQLLELVDGHTVTQERVKSIAEGHLQEIQAKIADLRKMEQTLSELADRCDGNDAADCPIIEALENGSRIDEVFAR